MQVRKLPKDAGPAAWNAILPPAPDYPTLEKKIRANWLVIGAGFTGLAAVRRLQERRPEDSIVLLEARRVAEGPAGRNSGFMIDLPHVLSSEDYGGEADHDKQQTFFNREAINFAQSMANDFGLSEEAFSLSGKINGAATNKGVLHNRNYAKHLNRLGETCTLLDAKTMQDITGSSYYRNGLFTPGTAMLQPAMFVRGIADGVARNGATIHEQSPVISLNRAGTGWVAETPSGSVTAGHVILAVNGHAESFRLFERRLMHIFLFASMTHALSDEELALLGGVPRWGITPADPMGTTMRRISDTGGNRLVVRNRVTFDSTMSVDAGDVASASAHHDRAFAARYPTLAGLDMAYRWSGQLCLSRNDAPAFGMIDEGLIAACCQNGLGTAKGTLSGMAAADLATGNITPIVDFLQKADGPAKLPPEPFCSIGAKTLIRWKEFRAGAEK